MTIEIAYAAPEKQALISLTVPCNYTIAEAISKSNILVLFPEIDLNKQKVGIFSKIKSLDAKLNEGDRIEIYRPLIIDPKESRRLKAKRASRG